MVLCKDIVPDPGYLVFYTNYLSAKGRQLADNPRAAAVMHWDALHRQVRIEGRGRAGAGGRQRCLLRLALLAEAHRRLGQRPERAGRLARRAHGEGRPRSASASARPCPAHRPPMTPRDFDIPRPPHWGGYRLWADAVELWVEGDARMHDRARWRRALSAEADGAFRCGAWSATRLQP